MIKWFHQDGLLERITGMMVNSGIQEFFQNWQQINNNLRQ